MRLHHDKHHQAYIDKLNGALEKYPDWAEKAVADLLGDLEAVPAEIKMAVRNHGGGHFNHSFFWEIMRPGRTDNVPEGELLFKLNEVFGDLLSFKEKFTTAALGQFGSGWVWLVQNGQGELAISTTANQDSPLELGQKPIIGCDVWEHAYYLKYQNRRAEYVDNFFAVINWSVADANFKHAKLG